MEWHGQNWQKANWKGRWQQNSAGAWYGQSAHKEHPQRWIARPDTTTRHGATSSSSSSHTDDTWHSMDNGDGGVATSYNATQNIPDDTDWGAWPPQDMLIADQQDMTTRDPTLHAASSTQTIST